METRTKIGKKILSTFLAMLMLFTACSVGLNGLVPTSYAATGSLESVKNALTDDVVKEIVYNGDLRHNNYKYVGKPEVVVAAAEIYAYALKLKEGNDYTSKVNSTAGMLNAVAKNTGYTSGDKYTALKYILDPTGDTISAIELVTPVKGGECNGCDHKYVYNTIPCDVPELKVTEVYASVSELVKVYGSYSAIPTSLLQGVSISYAHKTEQACLDSNEHKSGCDTVYDCYGYRWNYLRSVVYKEIKNIASVDELKEYGETLANADLSMTFEQMMALTPAELQEVYNENYGPYQEMIDKYSFETVKKLFGSYNTYFDNLLKAMQITLAVPALKAIAELYGAEYDKTDLDAMKAVYAPMSSYYNVIKDFSADVFDYIENAGLAGHVDVGEVKSYIDTLKYDIDIIVLTNLKPIVRADLDLQANKDAVSNLNDTKNPSTEILNGLLDKFNGYKSTIDGAAGGASTQVMQNEKVEVDAFVEKLNEKLSKRAPIESEFNGFYSKYMCIITGDYREVINENLISLYVDYDKNVNELQAAYNTLVENHGATAVDPLFSVTVNGGTPTLLHTLLASVKTSAQAAMKTELVARNHAQLVTVSSAEGLTEDVDIRNFISIGTIVKSFDTELYDFCAHSDRNWVPAEDKEIYDDIQSVLSAYNEVLSEVKGALDKVELSTDGIYTVRPLYMEDLIKTEAYTVSKDGFDEQVTKLDTFLGSSDFGGLIGLKDEDGNALSLGEYLEGMISDLLFTDDIMNMIIGLAFPMIEDLLVNQLRELLKMEAINPEMLPPADRNATGYVGIGSLLDGAEGAIDIYIGDTTFFGQIRKQKTFENLLNDAGLKIFPKIFADSMVSSGVITNSSDTYQKLAAAGASWANLGTFDPETETYTYDFDFDWGITDKASFAKALGGLFDALKPLLPTLFSTTNLDLTLGSESAPAGVGYGSIKYSIVSISNHEFYATLPLSIKALNLYGNVIQPLFNALGLTANASLSSSSKGIDYVNAILNPIFDLISKVESNPLRTILSLLPNLSYVLATDFIDERLSNIAIDLSVSLKIVGSDDGTFDTLAGLLGSLLTFEVFGDQLGIVDLLGASSLSAMLGFNLCDLNALIDYLLGSLGMDLDLPDIDQSTLMRLATNNGNYKLTADTSDVLWFLLDYVVSVLGSDLISGLLGGDEAEEGETDILTTILDSVQAAATEHPADVIAAIVELLAPVEYELREMEWVEGTPLTDVPYLKYMTDWKKEDSQYVIDNALEIVETVLASTGAEITDINAFLEESADDLLAGIFTNATITSLVEMLAGIGELDEMINSILVDELGIKLTAWANDYGYLFDETLVAPETKMIHVDAVKDDEGNITWGGLVDGDRDAFIYTLGEILKPAETAVAFLFGGKDLSVFDVIELKGYDSFDSTFGVLLGEVLGINLPKNLDFANMPMTSLTSLISAVLSWFEATLKSDDLVETAVDLIANLIHYIESNGLSVFIHNFLAPVLVLVDIVRPIVNIDADTLVSMILTDVVNGDGLDLNKILGIIFGTEAGENDITIPVTLDNLRLPTVLSIVDTMFGTNLVNSSLVTVGIEGMCNKDLDAADALTILLSAVIDCIDDPAKEEGKTNIQAIFEYLELDADTIQLVGTILNVIKGVKVEHSDINWAYMYGGDMGKLADEGFPAAEFKYLDYSTDWTETEAETVYEILDDVIDTLLPDLLEGKTIAGLVNGILEDNVYSQDVFASLVEMIINAVADFTFALEAADVILDLDTTAWLEMCEPVDGKYVVKAGELDVTDAKSFVEAAKKFIAPANNLLAWLFFGEDITFFDGSEEAALIKLTGGHGYAYGIAPILEALGLEMKEESAYLVNGKYDVAAAVGDILTAVLGLVDDIASSEFIVDYVFDLLPNLIYFVNAGGLKTSVNNLLAPLTGLLGAGIGDLIVEGYTDVNSLLASFIELPEWLDVTDLSMDTVFALLDTLEINGNKLVLSDDVIYAIENIYGVGKAEPYTAATGETAYRVAVNGYDVLTVLLSLAIEVFTTNNAIFADLLGADIYALIINAVKGANVVLTDINWAYMYDGDMDKLAAEGFPAPSFGYLDYSTDWTEEAAAGVYNALDDVADMFLPALLEEMGAENVADLINGILEDNVYSTEILGSVVEMIVNALGNFQFALEAVDVVLDVDTLAWFEMCDLVDGEYVFDAEKYAVTDRASFIKTLTEILAPANGLLAWFFFGENYTFFNGADGEALITLNGGKGYAYGLAPIFEALGLEMKVESEYLVDGKYDVAAAVGDILNAALDLVDGMTTSASVVEFAFDLIPNLLYFISADGLKTSVNNLIAPAAGLLAIPGVADALANILEVEDASSVAALINNFIELPVDITDLSFDTVIGLLDLVEIEGKKIVLTEDMTDALENIYAIGEADDYTAATGKTAYRVDVEGYDVLTVLLSFAIDAFKVNGEIFADLLGEEEYAAIIELINGAKDAFVYATPNWDYMGAELNETGDTYLPAYDKDSIVAKYYLKYGSDWNEETAKVVIDSVDKIVQSFFAEDESLGKLLEDAIANGLYQEDLLHSLIEMVVELIYDYGSLIEEAGAIFGIGAITEWFNYCEIETDEDGKLVSVTVTKDFGIDSAEGAAKAEAFVNAFVEVLAPAYEVLEWVFFANDITLFNGVDGSALITVTGGKGYEYGLVPLFEALGATMPGKAYEDGKSGIKSVAELEAEAETQNKEFMEVALYNVFSALTGFLADICGDLAAADEYGVITAMLDRLPNFIYNLNAGTLDVIVNNLLLPVEEVLQHLDAFGVELDIKAMLADFGVTSLDWYGVFALVEDLVNLYWPAEVQDFLANLYLGKLVAFESANGKTAYRVALTVEAPEGKLNTTKADVLTIILSFVLDGILDERNAPQLSDWLGEDIYTVIYNYLSGNIVKAEYVDINWLHTDMVGAGPISPVTWAESQFGELYNDVYTKDMGNYINFWLPRFVDTMITLIGINKNDGSGDIYSSLEDMLDSLIGTSIYTVDNVYALLNTITGLIDSLKAELGEDAFYAIADVLNAALDVDVTHWDNYEVTEFATGDRDAFVAELLEMLEPIYPILAWLLTGEDLIALFDVSTKGDEDTRALVVEGAEGYAKGIIPLLEAFDYDSELILTPKAYAEAAEGDAKTLLANIVNPLLNVVDTILADPVNEIFNVLPGLLYFVNSGGLDAVIKNTANAVFTVLANIEPLVGELDIYDLIGLYDIEGIEKGENGELVLDINTILTVLLADLEESTGFEFKDLAMDAVVELTVGEVVEYTSKNGDTAYTMVYANGADRADMATVVLRAALAFISIPENAAALEVMLEGELSPEGYDFVCALLENFSEMAADEEGIYEIMYTVYQLFYAVNNAAHDVDQWLDDFNGDYSYFGELFATSEVGFMQQIRVSLGSLLDKYTGDIIDGDELAPNGFVRFFQQIADFFKKIGEWFKNLFS